MKAWRSASVILLSTALCAQEAPSPAPAPAVAPAPTAAPVAGPAAAAGNPVADVATPGATAADASDGASQISADIAKRHQQVRLARELDALQETIEALPGDITQRAQVARDDRDQLGYENWLLRQEGQALRDSIERLRVRITLLESITKNQELVDRVRMVELQNALTSINSDDRQVLDQQRLAREALTRATLQIATREATRERLREVQRQLDALSPPAPVPPTVTAPAADANAAAPPLEEPAPTPAAPVAAPAPTSAGH